MSDAFAESVFHARHRVLGRRLRPLTLWHCWMLDFSGSWLAGRAEELTREDAVLAVWLCSLRPRLPGALPRMRWWARLRLARAAARVPLPLLRAQMAAYLADHAAPPVVFTSDSSRPVKSPWYLYLAAVLMRHAGFDERKAWATGSGYARHLALGVVEAEGKDIPLVSETEAAALVEAGHGGLV